MRNGLKTRFAIAIALGLALALGFTATAQAECQVISAKHGPPGSIVTVAPGPFTMWLTVFFGSTEVATDYSDHEYGEDYYAWFEVPATASVGNHEVIVSYSGHEHGWCTFIYTVEAPAQPGVTVLSDAYSVTIGTTTSLPSTGIGLLFSAAGLLGGGLGMLVIRKRCH